MAFSTARELYDKENVKPGTAAAANESGQGSFEPETYLEEYLTQFSQRLETEKSNKKDESKKYDDVGGDQSVAVKEEVAETVVSAEANKLLFQDANSLEGIPQEPIKNTQELVSYATVDFDRCPQSSQENIRKKKSNETGPSPAKRPNIPSRQKERIETIRSVHYPRGVNKQEMAYKKFFKDQFGRVRNVTEPPLDFGSSSVNPSSSQKPNSSKSGDSNRGTTKPPSNSSDNSKSEQVNLSRRKSKNSEAGHPKTFVKPRETSLGQMNKSPTKQSTQAPTSIKSASKAGKTRSTRTPSLATPKSIYEDFFSENPECPIPHDLPVPPQNEDSDEDGDEEGEEVLSADYAHLEDPGEGIENQLLNQVDNEMDLSAGNDRRAVQGQCDGRQIGNDGLGGHEVYVMQDQNIAGDIEEIENLEEAPDRLGGALQVVGDEERAAGTVGGEGQGVEDEERAPDMLGGDVEEDVQAAPGVFPSKQKETLGRSKIFPNLVERTVKS